MSWSETDQDSQRSCTQNWTFAVLAAAHSYAGSPDQAHTETWWRVRALTYRLPLAPARAVGR